MNLSTNCVVDVLGDDEALRRVAGLTGVLHAARDSGLHGGVEIVGTEHDERVRPTELEHHLLEVAAGDLGDRGARALGTGQRNPLHPWVGDGRGDLLIGGIHVDVGALGIAGIGEDLLNRGGRLGALRCVLEDDGVAQRQVRAREPRDLIVGIVPRHDPDQHADRAAADQRAALTTIRQFDGLVGEELLGVVGVVLVDRGAEVDLTERLVERFAHLALDDLGELVASLGVQLGDLLDQRGPLGQRRCARPFAVRLGRRRQRLLHLFVGRGRVLLHHIPGRGVDHCVQTHVTPLTHGSDLGVEVVAVPEA